MINDMSRESAKRMNDYKGNSLSILATIEEQFLKFRPVGRLSRLAFFNEYTINRKALLFAVRTTLALLRPQAQVLDLFPRRDSAIDNRTRHRIS